MRLEDIFAFFMAITVLSVGLIVNLFIVAVNVLDCFRGRPLKAFDKIQCSLAVSRMGYLCVAFFYSFASLFPSAWILQDANVTQFFNVIFFYTGLWFAALLSVLYFLKIANYKSTFFLLLKKLISQRVHYFILAAVLISLCNSYIQIGDMFTAHVVNNLTYVNEAINYECEISCIYKYGLVFSLGNVGPFVMYSSSFIFLLISMCRHMKQMRGRETGFTTNHLDGYYVAIKSMTACFLLYTLQFITNIVYFLLDGTSSVKILEILLDFLPSLHSCYLVYGTPKLRQQLSFMWLCVQNCWAKRGIIASNKCQNP